MSGHLLVGGESERAAARAMDGESPLAPFSRDQVEDMYFLQAKLARDLAAALRVLLDNPTDPVARCLADKIWGRSLPF